MTKGVLDRRKWNQFIIENNGLFLQSWKWGEFQESLGRKIWRLGDGDNWQALVIKYDLPWGKNYLYCPSGPIISNLKTQSVLIPKELQGEKRLVGKLQLKAQSFLNEIQEIAEQEKSIFLKIEPFWEENNNVFRHPEPQAKDINNRNNTGDEILPTCQARGQNDIMKVGFQKSDGGQRILKTLVLDLGKPEEQLLTEMKQKTRYNIKIAEKRGVKIRISENLEKDIEVFWQLAQKTAERDGFGIHLKEHYKKLLFINSDEMSDQVRHDRMEVKLFLAEWQNEIIAANVVVFFGNRTVYLHGASANEHRNLMAPYLLQWEQIKEARKRGYKIYDFWGIDEEKWPGVTRFKKGFSGQEVDYIGTYDYVFDKMWYRMYKFVKQIYKT